jgi:TPR repeat protein
MKNSVFASWLYRRTFKKFLKQIRERVNEAEELWEIDQEMDMLWRLGDKGEFSAFIVYAMILLRDDKQWYDARQGMSMLETLSEEGFAPAQYLFGSLKFNGIKDVAEDKVTGLYWIQKAAESGNSEAQAFIKMRSEGC